jgi:AraC-like DNA-binding protein
MDQSYRERLPLPQLARDVSCVWTQQVAHEAEPYEHRTVPNGCAELEYVLGRNTITVIGARRGPDVARLTPGSTVVGVRFRPGAAASLLGPPAAELVDTRVPLDGLWGGEASRLADRLAEAADAEIAARLLEDAVARRSSEADEADPLVTAAIGRLQPWRRDDLATWAAGLFISPRQLRRRFVSALGFGPKTFQRIRRFQGFIALSQLGRGELTRLALDAGYADQAHLTRECAELTGLTPRAFLDETEKSCGANHDHEVSYAGLRRALLG